MSLISSIFAASGIAEVPVDQVAFLCGAGISYPPPTRLPTVSFFIDQIVRHCIDGAGALDLIAQIQQPRTPIPRFEVLVEAISQLGVDISSIGAIFDSPFPNALHRFLGIQCEEGAAIITTNFDNCLERALKSGRARVVFQGIDLENAGPTQSVIVKPHGSNPFEGDPAASELVVSIRALGRTARGFQFFPIWRDYLRSLLSDRIVVVVGYSGSDDFDISPVLLESKPRNLIWLDYDRSCSPQRADQSLANASVQPILKNLPAVYLRGDLSEIIPDAVKAPSVLAPDGSAGTAPLDIWLDSKFPSPANRQELLCVLLRHYSLHDLTLARTMIALSAEAMIQRGTAHYYRGNYRDACSTLNGVAAHSPTAGQSCRTAYLLSAAYYYSGDLTAARTASRENLALAERMHDVGEIQTALNHAAALSYSAGDYDKADRLYRRVLGYQSEYPFIQAAAMATWGLADIANAAGRTDDAIEGYTTARTLSHQLGSGPGVAWMSANLGELLLHRRDFTESERYLGEAEKLFGQLANAAGLLYAHACRAQLEYCRDNIDAASNHLKACLPLLDEHKESAAISTVILLAYLVAADTTDRSILLAIQKGSADGTRVASKHSGDGAAQLRWDLCSEVLKSASISASLYQRCRLFIVTTEKLV